MPHQCVRCGIVHEDTSEKILQGCACGGRLFFFIRKEKLQEAQKVLPPELSTEQKQEMEKDILELVGAKLDDTPVVLDFESIRVLQPGKYEIDLVKLFKGDPVVIKLEEGKYVIDLAETFARMRKK